MRLAFIDTETTGLNPQKHEILDFAAIVVEDGKVLNTFQCKIKPRRIEEAEEKALEVNGYAKNSKDWDNAPYFEEVAPTIVEVLEGAILVGHNVSFDENFIKENLRRHKIAGKIPYHKIDTVTLAYEHLFPLGLKRASLDSIRDFLGWPKDGAHSARQDAEDCRQLFDLCWRMSPWKKLTLYLHLKSLRNK